MLIDAVFGATARSTPGLAGRSAGGIAVAKITPGDLAAGISWHAYKFAQLSLG